jgi:hypothetical protein
MFGENKKDSAALLVRSRIVLLILQTNTESVDHWCLKIANGK